MKLTSADVEEVIRKRLLEEPGRCCCPGSPFTSRSPATSRPCSTSSTAPRPTATTPTKLTCRHLPVRQLPVPAFPGRDRGHLGSQRVRGPQQLRGRAFDAGVVQQVAKDIGDVEVGRLATFDHMFAGIRASLKSAAQRSIDVAERNLDNPLAIRLLKALFLVKYVDSFQATARNLTVLVYDRFGLDLPALSKQVKDALTLLETQTHIQRNGTVYEYLTNEEQVIEEEIKNVDIDVSDVSSRLFKIPSGDVIKTNKIRYAKNGQDFPFGFKLDDQVHGPQRELSIHFIFAGVPAQPRRGSHAQRREGRAARHPRTR